MSKAFSCSSETVSSFDVAGSPLMETVTLLLFASALTVIFSVPSGRSTRYPSAVSLIFSTVSPDFMLKFSVFKDGMTLMVMVLSLLKFSP